MLNNPAAHAIEYALSHDEPEAFLRCWMEGNFDAIRREWEDVPEEVFIGADPTHPETIRMLEEPKILAWMDSGDTLFCSYTKHRVVTDETKQSMSVSVAKAYTRPLIELEGYNINSKPTYDRPDPPPAPPRKRRLR